MEHSYFAKLQCLQWSVQTVNTICKGKDKVESCLDLKNSFLEAVDKKLRHYNQGRIIFDEYKSGSLKDKTRAKRLDGIQPVEFTWLLVCIICTDHTHMQSSVCSVLHTKYSNLWSRPSSSPNRESSVALHAISLSPCTIFMPLQTMLSNIQTIFRS